MLVLSRRAGEKIVFPSIGVTIHMVRTGERVARVGIEAPPELRVLREELTAAPPAPPGRRAATHELCNRVSRVSLALHLFQRQREAGRAEEAEATLGRALAALEALDRDAIGTLVGGAAPAPARPAVRALLVEDDSNERELLAGLLGMNGCECATAADGLEALDYLAAHDRPDVVLLDMQMPRCDGPSTLRAIRAEPRLAGVRVFGVSGTPPHEVGVPTGPGGIDGWFPKPLNPRGLWDAVRRCVSSPVGNN